MDWGKVNGYECMLKGCGEKMEGGMAKEVELIDFSEVFKVLREAEYDHREDAVFKACFKNWKVPLDNVEGMVAGLVRLALFKVMVEVIERLNNKEYDERDILFLLILEFLGIEKCSRLVEITERGLEKAYEQDFSRFDVYMERLLKGILEGFEEEGEVIMQ